MIVYQSKEKVLINSMENITDDVLFEIERIEYNIEEEVYTVNAKYSSTTRLIKPVYKRIKKEDREISFNEADIEELSAEFLNENAFWGLSADDYEIVE